MAGNVPPPPAFLPSPGEPTMPFEMWMRMFNNYLLVINATGNSWPEGRKRATLLHCLGTEGQRLFYSLPETGDTIASAVTALEKYFTPKVNVVVERHLFRKRKQAPHETIVQYVAALRDLASRCNFEDKMDEMIRDQLIEHVTASRIRERLLLEPDLSLDKAITLATQVESAANQAKSMATDHTTPVQAIQQRPPYKKKSQQNKRPSKPPDATASSAPTCCFRCGSDKHLANYPQCPAAKAKCKSCSKIGHFARVCRSAKTSDVHEIHLPKVTVLYLRDASHAPKKIHCDVTACTPTSPNVDLSLVVDSGSAVSILPYRTYEKCFSDTALQPPAMQLVTYTKRKIPLLGCLGVKVSRGNVSSTETFYVVKRGTPILGRDLMNALKICIKGNTVLPPQTAVMTTDTAPTQNSVSPEIGCVQNFVHKVKLDPTVKPVRQKLRRLPFAVRSSVSAELDRLLNAGVIERIDASPWVSPIVVTGRKTGGIRMCADLREPNKAVIIDCYPLPHVDELFTNLHGAKVFSSIDLANAYYQLPLHEDSRDLTAFITHDGLFRFRRVPYGLASAPSAFQKMMAEILKDIPGVQNYLDDLIVYGKTLQEHDQNLHTVLHKLKEAGLVLNDNKCNFRKPSLRFLGHVITADGILPDQEHIDAVTKAPPPSDAVTLRSFLGLVSWYSKFLPNFATVVAPMRDCANNKDTFKWSSEAQNSFEEVKRLLVNSPALTLFDPALQIVISTDASDYGLGGVFTQVQPDGTEKPVAFASRTLTSTERKYSTVEKEALACVWATEKWRTYLWGRRFILRTDHQALTTLLSTKGMGRAGMRIARWSARLLCFDYDVVYRPGTQNYTADCLSRLPLPLPADFTTDAEPEMVAHISAALSSLPVTDFDTACAACPELSALRAQIDKGWPATIKPLTEMLTPYYKIRDELSTKDNYILRGSRLIAPLSLRHNLITLAHESHQGIVRTKQRLRDLYWWPGMDSQVQTAIASCVLCQSNDKTACTRPAPLQPVPLPDGPWKKLGLDIVGPFETAASDCRFAITLTDYYSKWPELAFSRTATTDDVVHFLSSVFSRHGDPENIVTDNGTQFTSAAFASFLQSRGISHSKTSVYYPAANGAIERFHRALRSCIQSAIQESQPWKDTVTNWLQIYRATPHATTATSPYELMYGRKMRTKLNILPLPTATSAVDDNARKTVRKRQNKMQRYTDAKRGAREPSFRPGERVRVRKPQHVPKAHPRFTPPETVERNVGTHSFLLSDGKVWNATHLAHCPVSEKDSNITCPFDKSATETTPKQPRTKYKPTWHNDYVMP
uniref:Gypsy retrotransposon integrase-like protein 1 n=1 Tax=Neogobius melanostomus TaxID=47308 RepID=A0A8C6V5S1_9GOBI